MTIFNAEVSGPPNSEISPFPHLNSSVWFTLFLSITLFFNIYLRIFPSYLPGLQKQAVQEVLMDIAGKKNKPFSQERNSLQRVVDLENNILTKPDEFNKKVDEKIESLKNSLQDPNGRTYLSEVDPYAWAIYTKNLSLYGHPGDTLKDSKSWDSLSLAPKGAEAPYSRGLFYLTVSLYRLAALFGPVSLEAVIFFVPVFYSAVLIMIIFIGLARIYGTLPAFLSTMAVGLAPIVLQRSSAGWYDHEILNLIWIALSSGCLLHAVALWEKKKPWLTWAIAAGAFLGFLGWTWWVGWVFIWCLFLIFIISNLAILLWKKRKDRFEWTRIFKFHSILFTIIFLTPPSLFYVLTGKYFFFEVLPFLNPSWIGADSGLDIWPNPLFFVAELKPFPIEGFMSFFFGFPISLLFIISIAVLFSPQYWKKQSSRLLFLVIWTAAWLVMTLHAVRFIFYFVFSIAICFGITWGAWLPVCIRRFASNPWKRIAFNMAYIGLLGIIVFQMMGRSLSFAESLRPLMNDARYKAMEWIKTQTPSDAIINAPWDAGNWIKYYGKRRVVFDSQSQNALVSFWWNRALMSHSEKDAIAIMRMLNNASSSTLHKILKTIPDPYQGLETMEKLLLAGRSQAAELLEKMNFLPKEKDEILKDIFNCPAPAYLMIYGEALTAASESSFFANWDFKSYFAYRLGERPKNGVVKRLMEQFSLSLSEAENIHQKVFVDFRKAPPGQRFSRQLSVRASVQKSENLGEMVYFENGLVFDEMSGDALIYDAVAGHYDVPRQIKLYDQGHLEINKYNEAGRLEAVVVREGGYYESLVCDSELGDTLLVRLLLLRGSGLKHFELVYADEESQIYIYKIIWEAKDERNM